MNYQDFKKLWNGRRVDYDNVYAYQCVDLILQYLKDCFGINSGVWGNAIDYWNNPTRALLQRFDKLNTTDCKQGDIVVLNGLAGNPFGHIGICESQDASNVTILEQNGYGGGDGFGKNAIGVYRSIPKSRIAGILRPRSTTPIAQNYPSQQSTVTLPAHAQSWRLYRVGSGLRPNTSDQIAVLAPARYGGLTYKIEAWVGDYAVVIQTQMFGRGVVWVKNTDAIIKR